MAATTTSGEGTINGGTPVEVVPANTDRLSFAFRVRSGEVWLGPDNTVAADDGWYWEHRDGVFADAVPTLDAWWATARAGTTARFSWIEITDTP